MLDVPTVASTSKLNDEPFKDMISGLVKLKTVLPGFGRGMWLNSESGQEEERVVFEEWQRPKIREAIPHLFSIFSVILCLLQDVHVSNGDAPHPEPDDKLGEQEIDDLLPISVCPLYHRSPHTDPSFNIIASRHRSSSSTIPSYRKTQAQT